MNSPIQTFKSGKMQLSIWQGEFQGKTTYSCSIKKSTFDQQTKQWKDSAYYGKQDLMDLQFVTHLALQYLHELNQRPAQQNANAVNQQFNDPYQGGNY